MAEYIEREAAISECLKYNCADKHDKWALKCLLKLIPAADVVAVVRCKDCKWNTGAQGNFVQCNYWLDLVKPNGFCSYGERRTDNATD